MTGGVTVASAETNTAMEGLENKLLSQSQTEKGTKIPVKSRLPLPKKHTNNHSAIPVVATNLGSSPERSQKNGKSSAYQDQEKSSLRMPSRLKPITAASRKGGEEGKSKSGHESSVKENVAPNNGGQRQVNPTATSGVKKASTKR